MNKRNKADGIKTALMTAFFVAANTAMAFAAEGEGGYGFNVSNGVTFLLGQLRFAILLVVIVLSVLYFFQKQTVKMFTTLIVGGIIYLVAADTSGGIITSLGNGILHLFGVK